MILQNASNPRTLTVDTNAVAKSVDFNSTQQTILAIANGASLTLSEGITWSNNTGIVRVEILNQDVNNTGVLTATGITNRSLVVGTQFGDNTKDYYFSFGNDMNLSVALELGSAGAGVGDRTYAHTQTGGTASVGVNNPTFGVSIGVGSTTAAASGSATYNLDGGVLEASRIGVLNGQGNNNNQNRYAMNGVLNFNNGTIRTPSSSNLTFENGRAFLNYDGTGTKDMRLDTSRALEIRLSDGGTNTFEATTGRDMVVSGSARVVDQAGEAGTIRKIGAGNLVFAGGNTVNSNTWTGATTVEAGAVLTDYSRIAAQEATGGQDLLADAYSAASSLVLEGGNYTMTGRNSAAASSITGRTLTNGVFNVNVGSTDGLVIGQAVSNAFLPTGTYIRRLVNATTIELSAMSTSTANQTGQTLDFGAASFDNRQTINAVQLNSNAVVTVNPGAGTSTTLLEFGEVSGAGGLTKAGTGTLLLTGNNTYAGGTLLNAGTLRLDHANAAGSGMITQASNTILQINTTGTVANAMSIFNIQTLQTVTLSGNKTLNNATYTVEADTTTTESGNLTGDGGITKQGTGTLLVTGNNDFTGAVAVNEGVLELASTLGGAAANTVSVSVASGATLLLSQSEQVSDTAAVSLSGGTIQRGAGVSEVFGALTIVGGSTLDFGTGAIGDLQFQNYTYTGSSLIQLQNFLPGNRLQFLSSSFNSGNLTQFDFNGFGYDTGLEGSYFTITAIPEPSTALAAFGLLALSLWSARGRIAHHCVELGRSVGATARS